MKSRSVLSVALSIAFCCLFRPEVALSQQKNVERVEAALLEQAARNIEKYRKGEVQIVFKHKTGRPVRNAQLKVRQVSSDFLVGCIIFDLIRDSNPYRAELYKERFKELFNFAVFPFYWAEYEPVQGQPQWERLLPVLEWCKANGITTKGHPLVWTAPSGKPRWLPKYSGGDGLDLLKARVMNTVAGFEGKIGIWDVFNEAVNTRAWDDRQSEVWMEVPPSTNADLVEKAFKWAYSANPQAHLILNDFYQIAKKNTRQRFYDLVQELLKRKTPISGLGIQAHEPRQEWYPPQEVVNTFERLAEFGLPLHVTEFTPQSGEKEITGGWRSGKWTEQAQADFAEQFFKLAFSNPSVASINFWGFSDRRVWQAGGGLVNEDYRPKPIFNRLKKLLHEDWRTSLDLSTDNSGAVAFRGFFGKYQIDLKTETGPVRSFEMQVRKDEENRWVFTLDD